jgi:hypothetical protein
MLAPQPKDWYALGQVFPQPYCFDNPKGSDTSAKKYGVSIGIQVLSAVDAVDGFYYHAKPLSRAPGALTAQEVLSFLNEVFSRHGKPRLGVIVGHSVWMSSHEMLLDDDIAERAQILKELDVEIGPMQQSEKDEIRTSLTRQGLRVEFDPDDMKWN